MYSRKSLHRIGAALCAAVWCAAGAAGQTIYSNVPSTLAGNYPSVGYQATSTAEFGDRISFGGVNRNLTTVTVTMSSWARSEDFGNAVTFTHPMTMNIYAAGVGNLPGALLATKTQTMTIPFRPTGYGFNGIAANVVFDFTGLNVTLPNDIVYGIAYNTQSYGTAPTGMNGPYNSLNFALNTAPAGGITVGSNADLDDVFWNTSHAPFYSDGGVGGVGILRRDTVWTGYTPMVKFDAPTVTMDPASTCVNNNTVVVNINKGETNENVVGGQFFIQYDSSILTLVSAVPAGPYSMQVYSATPGVGQLDYAVGVPFGNPGTSAPATMATLTFSTASNVCATASNLVTFRPHTPATRLTNSVGAVVGATFVDMPSIRIDNTGPVINCPPDITTNADAGGCTYAILGPGWRTFGDASLHDGGAELPSTTTLPNHYSGVVYTPSSPLLFGDLATLSTDYTMLQGCFNGGSARFEIEVDTNNDNVGDGNVFVYLGDFPNFNNCPAIGVPSNTGNMVAAPDLRWDTGQFAGLGGTFYDSHAHAVSMLGSGHILSIAFVMDGSWAGNQNLIIDNMTVDSNVQAFNFTGPTATDNCTAAPAISYVRSDGRSIASLYPTGTTTVTWTATDSCGNTSSCNQLVTVNAANSMTATVQLESVSAGTFTRCITFGLPTGGCTTFVSQVMTFTGGVGTATFDIPCGSYNCLTARDTLHTLRRTAGPANFYLSGPNYIADFTGGKQLLGGNLNDDNVVDILDFGAFVGQYGQTLGASTTCGTSYPHSDISGDGTVGTGDFSYIQIHFLNFNEADCCGALRPPGVRSISVDALVAMGNPEMAAADLNDDGFLDEQDMDIFAVRGGNANCTSDVDGDGDYGTDADIEAFFACLGGSCCHLCGSSDFNGDGDFGTDADIESFFRVLAGGPC